VALLPTPPVQTDIEPRGPGGPFPGVAVAEFPPEAVERVADLLAEVLGLWPEEDVVFARRCLAQNGGLAALHFAIYEEGAAGGWFPVFRLEGPGAVIHWRGWPHLHAFCHVTLDGARPLRAGEVLGTCARRLERAGAAAFLERALVSQTGADLGFYPLESVAARVPAGPVRTGDLYTLESWLDDVALLEVPTASLASELLARLSADQRARPTVTVATTGHAASELAAARIGRGRRLPLEPLSVRDALITHARAHGFGNG